MASQNAHPYGRLTLITSIFVLTSNIFTACLAHRLPDDPLHVSTHILAYSWFSSFLSLLGVIGAKKRSATLVAIFANYLIIDVIICTLPRLITLMVFPSIRDSLCSENSINAWVQAQQPLNQPQEMETAPEEMGIHCRHAVGLIQIVAAVMTISVTAVQAILALRVKAYAGLLQRQETEFEGGSEGGVPRWSSKLWMSTPDSKTSEELCRPEKPRSGSVDKEKLERQK